MLAHYPAGRTLVARPPDDAQPGSEEVLGAGTVIGLGDNVTVQVIDVRLVDERVALDLLVLVEDVAIWLPGPGPPSQRWADVERNDRSILRLPMTAAAWLRDPATKAWIAVIGQEPRTSAATLLATLYLDHRQRGAAEIRIADGLVSLRTERCVDVSDCEVMTFAPSQEAVGALSGAGGD